MRSLLGSFLIVGVLGACGGDDKQGDDVNPAPDACVGLECNVTNCAAQNKPATTITGKVFAPNGSLPLWNVNVYVPRDTPLPAFTEGAECSRCNDELPGSPVRTTTTDETGAFTLTDVPSGDNIPLVIQIGKWRRQITIPNVPACVDTSLPNTDTRLPKNRSEGDIPRIALSTGEADGLECLLRKLGIEDGEIGTGGGDQRIHLFDDGDSPGAGTGSFQSGGNFADSKTLWQSVDTLKPYDLVILSCEGGKYPETKSQDNMNAMKAYADLGGRVFASHWHNVWIDGGGGQAPLVWSEDAVATWKGNENLVDGSIDIVDETTGHGTSFATWLQNVGASPMRGEIPIQDNTGRSTVASIGAGVERWVFYRDGAQELPQNFQFTTPFEADSGARCGKVVFSDMHVSGDSTSSPGEPFPSGCSNSDLTPQEKALAFMFFDIASCVSVIL